MGRSSGAAASVIVAAVICTGGWAAAAQDVSGRISGAIRDAQGMPLDGVTVSLEAAGDTRATTTDGEGRYQFESLPARRYQITARKEPLLAQTQVIDLGAGAAGALDFDLRPSYAATVIVTAARDEQSLISAPATVAVIGPQEIASSAAETIPDLLRSVPGVNVAQFGARDLNVNTRSSTGVLSNAMLVMVDGRPFFQPFYGAVYWDLLTVSREEISQIEIMRSPASAMWGANALNGVANIRTLSPRALPTFSGHASFGERGTASAGSVWADSTERLSYKLSGSYYRQDAWERDNTLPNGSPMPPDVVFQNRGTTQPKFDARIDWDADPAKVWSLRGGLAGANGLTHSALGPGEFERGSYYGYLEVDRRAGSHDIKAYWNHLHSPFRIVLFGLDEHSANDTYGIEVTRRHGLGAHDLTFGGSFRLDRFDVSIAPGEGKRVEAGGFISDTVQIGRMVSAVIGGRVDKFDTTDAVFAPRLGVVVTPHTAHSFRATYNRAFRAPSLLENFIDVTLPAVVPLPAPFFYTQLVLGSTDLKMEQNDAFEIGYTGEVHQRVTISAAVYHQRVSDDVRFLPVAFYHPGAPPPGWPADPAKVPLLPRVFGFVNLGEVRDRGVELSARVDAAPMSIQASYTFQDSPLLEAGTGLSLPINRPPHHQGGIALIYTPRRWVVGGDIHYTGRAFWSDVFTEPFWGFTDAYVAVNARASYRLNDRAWELWVNATNLFDESIKSHVFGDIIRRKISAGVRWRWTDDRE